MTDTLCRAGARMRSAPASILGLTFVLTGLAAAICSGQVSTGSGDNSPSGVPSGAIRVEEDWQIIMKEPSPATDSPQIMVVFGPADPESDTHAVFELNHSTQPNYQAGGMQLQVWWGESLIDYRNQHYPAELYVDSEQITFTTATTTANNKITMEVLNGQSQSFGTFGGQSYLRAAVNLSKANLDGFDPDFSLQHSGVGWGKNRVQKLSRTGIRYFDKNGNLVGQDTTEQVVHQFAP